MLRLSVIKSCFGFPDGVSLPPGWDEATVLWSWRECGPGLWPVVALTVKVSGPLQNRVTPIGEIGRRDGFKFRCLRACRFESCIGDIMIILLRTAVLRRVIFF